MILLRDVDGEGDFIEGDLGLETDDGLESLVYMLLFTDARADPSDEIPDGTTDPRGWWAETYGYAFGSKLWLLSRAKTTADVLARSTKYAKDALSVLVTEGIAKGVDVTTTRDGSARILQVSITRSNGTRWSGAWNAQSGVVAS